MGSGRLVPAPESQFLCSQQFSPVTKIPPVFHIHILSSTIDAIKYRYRRR